MPRTLCGTAWEALRLPSAAQAPNPGNNQVEQRRRLMRLAITGAVLGTAALFAVTGPMSAQAVEFDVGPGGVHVDRGHRWDHSYNQSACRIIITHRTNRFGD